MKKLKKKYKINNQNKSLVCFNSHIDFFVLILFKKKIFFYAWNARSTEANSTSLNFVLFLFYSSVNSAKFSSFFAVVVCCCCFITFTNVCHLTEMAWPVFYVLQGRKKSKLVFFFVILRSINRYLVARARIFSNNKKLVVN